MTDPDFDKIAGALADAFRRAAFDRMMHEDGCPEGEQIKAGIAAIAPTIWRAGVAEGLELAAEIADEHKSGADQEFDARVTRARKGERNLDLAASAAAGMSHTGRKIAVAIRKLKEGRG